MMVSCRSATDGSQWPLSAEPYDGTRPRLCENAILGGGIDQLGTGSKIIDWRCQNAGSRATKLPLRFKVD